MTTIEDTIVYRTEVLAFSGTPLGDRQDRASLIHEAHEIVTQCSVLVGEITIEEGSAHMTRNDAYAQGMGRIVFAPTDIRRHIAVHEIAHIVHARSNLRGRSHGQEWRGVYATMLGIVYGSRYEELIREAFRINGLFVQDVNLGTSAPPIIQLDVFAAATQRTRWL